MLGCSVFEPSCDQGIVLSFRSTAADEFVWAPSCTISELLVYHSETAESAWLAEGTLRSPLRYGEKGATVAGTTVDPLVPGDRYMAVAYRHVGSHLRTVGRLEFTYERRSQTAAD
jgi:hypothetical protein